VTVSVPVSRPAALAHDVTVSVPVSRSPSPSAGLRPRRPVPVGPSPSPSAPSAVPPPRADKNPFSFSFSPYFCPLSGPARRPGRTKTPSVFLSPPTFVRFPALRGAQGGQKPLQFFFLPLLLSAFRPCEASGADKNPFSFSFSFSPPHCYPLSDLSPRCWPLFLTSLRIRLTAYTPAPGRSAKKSARF
jgi:hypothetical protein